MKQINTVAGSNAAALAALSLAFTHFFAPNASAQFGQVGQSGHYSVYAVPLFHEQYYPSTDDISASDSISEPGICRPPSLFGPATASATLSSTLGPTGLSTTMSGTAFGAALPACGAGGEAVTETHDYIDFNTPVTIKVSLAGNIHCTSSHPEYTGAPTQMHVVLYTAQFATIVDINNYTGGSANLAVYDQTFSYCLSLPPGNYHLRASGQTSAYGPTIYGSDWSASYFVDAHLHTSPGDINCDGVVNVDDLLAVINAWGACPAPPQACPADIAPPGGNGVVNVDDLLMVINNWG